jgi:alpha-L-fucosidase
MANSWSYVPNDTYKSPKEILRNLFTIVSRGGNYLLNIAPNANGEWDNQAYENLKAIGQWMKINGEAIYGTRRHHIITETPHYFYTFKNGVTYCIYLKEKGQDFPSLFPIEFPRKPESVVHVLGADQLAVNYEWKDGMNWAFTVPENLKNQEAIVFYFK